MNWPINISTILARKEAKRERLAKELAVLDAEIKVLKDKENAKKA